MGNAPILGVRKTGGDQSPLLRHRSGLPGDPYPIACGGASPSQSAAGFAFGKFTNTDCKSIAASSRGTNGRQFLAVPVPDFPTSDYCGPGTVTTGRQLMGDERDVYVTPTGPRATISGPAALRSLLDELEETVRSFGGHPEVWLQPGLTPEAVESTLAKVELRANDELITWFGWHNGVAHSTDGLGRPLILPGIVPGDLQGLTQRYRASVFDMVIPSENGAVMEPRLFTWGLGFGWLPLESSNQTRYAVSCHGAREAVPLIRRAEAEAPFDSAWDDKLQAVSLCTPVLWWLEALANGAYQFDAQNQAWSDADITKLPSTQIDAGFV